MYRIVINCSDNEIQCDTTTKDIYDCENISGYLECCLIKLPDSLKQYTKNVKFLRQQITEIRSWDCTATMLEIVDYDLPNRRNNIYDYLVFEFETEEEAFYFKLKYGGD